MVIVLVWWRIKPTEEAAAEFRAKWRGMEIDDTAGLFEEFLSAPIPAEDLPFTTDDLRSSTGSYRTFVNVALWRTVDDFNSQVGRYIPALGQVASFEAEPRTRTLLTPTDRRMGDWNLSDE